MVSKSIEEKDVRDSPPPIFRAPVGLGKVSEALTDASYFP